MFLAAEWNRSSVSERAYLLAMLFGREFDVEANDLSLQIASFAMTMGEPDGSAALIARVDLGAAPDHDVTRNHGGGLTGAVLETSGGARTGC
jgi:hypothetical protein